MNSYKHINFAHLKEISDGNNEFILDLIDLFVKQVPTLSQQLDDLYKSKEYLALGKLAHKIKGSVATMGIAKLAQSMKEFEQIAKEGVNVEQYPIHIEDYKSTCKEAIYELEDLRNRIKS